MFIQQALTDPFLYFGWITFVVFSIFFQLPIFSDIACTKWTK